jgi:hypothetical protein
MIWCTRVRRKDAAMKIFSWQHKKDNGENEDAFI